MLQPAIADARARCCRHDGEPGVATNIALSYNRIFAATHDFRSCDGEAGNSRRGAANQVVGVMDSEAAARRAGWSVRRARAAESECPWPASVGLRTSMGGTWLRASGGAHVASGRMAKDGHGRRGAEDERGRRAARGPTSARCTVCLRAVWGCVFYLRSDREGPDREDTEII